MIGRTSNQDGPDLAGISQLIQGILTQLENIETEVSSTDRAVQLITIKLDDLINRLDRNQFLEQHSMSKTGSVESIPFLARLHLPALPPFLGLASVGASFSTDNFGDRDDSFPEPGTRAPTQNKKIRGNHTRTHAK